MRAIILIFAILVLQAVFILPAQAQRTYITRKGKLVVKTVGGDSLVIHEFKNINVLLDYDRAEIVINFKLDDSLDEHIPANRFFYDYDVAIKSRLSLSKIETQPHPDQYFSVKGHLIYNEAGYYITGDGVLEHREGSEIMSCLLTTNIRVIDDKKLFFDSLGQVESIFLFQNVLNREVLEEWEKLGY